MLAPISKAPNLKACYPIAQISESHQLISFLVILKKYIYEKQITINELESNAILMSYVCNF